MLNEAPQLWMLFALFSANAAMVNSTAKLRLYSIIEAIPFIFCLPTDMVQSHTAPNKQEVAKSGLFVLYHFVYLMLAFHYLDTKDMSSFYTSHAMNVGAAVLFGLL